MSSRDKFSSPVSSATSNKSYNRSQTSKSATNNASRSLSSSNTRTSTKKNKKPNQRDNSNKSSKKLQPNLSDGAKLIDIENKNSSELTTSSFQFDSQVINEPDLNIMEQETKLDGSKQSHSNKDGHDDDHDPDADADEGDCLLSSESSRTIVEPEPSLSTSSNLRSDLNNFTNNQQLEPLPKGWEQHSDKAGQYFWHVTSGTIQRERPTSELSPSKDSIPLYHDDEEINQAQRTFSDDDDFYESGAALTADDTSESTFVVYPLGSCEFDETQLMSITSSKAIQKCILRLSNKPTAEETNCWGLDQSQPLLMKLFDDYIQFTDLKTNTLLRSQPIQTIKTWAVDDDNNFAFVIEDRSQQPTLASDTGYYENADYSLLSEPTLVCYVFRSLDDDDMSCKVAAKLNEEISRYKEQLSDRISKSTRMQQMIEPQPIRSDLTDVEDFDELEASNELTMTVKYIGKTSVSRPTGIDILNIAIDKCLAEASKNQTSCQSMTEDGGNVQDCFLEAKLHVSPSSVIVENVVTGEIIVECRIRYLTFMGISKRDIRWCGFIMQNATNKTFVAHCFECSPTAGHVCEAIQTSCTKMYEKVVKNSRQPETMSIVPTRSKIRNTLAKTFSRIKLNPMI